MTTLRLAACLLTLVALACGQGGAPAGDTAAPATQPARAVVEWSPPSAPAQAADLIPREPCAHNDPLRQVFFGDLHTHTAFSLDALGRGGFQTPDDAYRFARGEEIGLSPVDAEGRPTRTAQLDRPLDFAAVTDHSEWLGEVTVCTDPSSPVYDSPACRGLRPGGTDEERAAWQADRLAGRGPLVCGEDASQCRDGLLTAWGATQAAAERYYDRSSDCSFTAFHAWEYTRAPGRSKVHRNVILRNEIAPELPISWIDADQPRDLWTRLKARCNDSGTGCEALTIPHNPNISNGQMFTLDWGGLPIDEQRARAALRNEMEPLVEMMQAKGESECRRGMWNVIGGEDGAVRLREGCATSTASGRPTARTAPAKAGSAARAASRGSTSCATRSSRASPRRNAWGFNPIQLGLIASTDGHNGLPGDTDEYDYQGHNSNVRLGPGEAHYDGCLRPASAAESRGAGGRLGRGELARLAVRRDAAQGDLRHQRRAHPGAALRRLGSARPVREQRHDRRGVRGGRADGQRAAGP